jgi:hypothetical protein
MTSSAPLTPDWSTDMIALLVIGSIRSVRSPNHLVTLIE